MTNAVITKPTSRQNQKINSLLKDFKILVSANGEAHIERQEYLDAKTEFNRKFSEIFNGD